MKTFEGHTSSVLRASFLTRGTQFVSSGMKLSGTYFALSINLMAFMINLIDVSGADGLVKLWTVKSNECIATYDNHEDKVLVNTLLYFFTLVIIF